MGRFLRNIRIHTAMIAVLAMFMLFIVAIAGMGFVAERSAARALTELDSVSVEQLGEINRADALLNVSRSSLEAASNYMLLGRMGQVDDQLATAQDRLERAESRFNAFVAAPKSDEAKALAEALDTDFDAVMSLVRQQHEALDQMDTTRFNRLREDLAGPSAELAESMTAYVNHGFSRSDVLVSGFREQSRMFEWIGLALLLVIAGLVVMIYLGLRRVIIRPLNRAVESLDAIAKADLTVSIPEGTRNEVGRLFSAMRGMQQSLIRIVGDVRTSSESIHVGTREIATGNADLSSRTEQQAASLEETASSMEELTTTVRQNADNARQASGLAVEASNTAERGGEVVGRVVSTMDGISDSSKKISDITGLIDSIAFQTNILALNASVEAARAGEQGRGFAVVAGEVRNLASRSATAAKDIKALIDGSVAQIKDGSILAREAGETMQEVVKAVRRVTDIMDEISAASQEQSDGIEQVSQAVGQMDQVTQQNASLVQQATAAAASLEEQASRLEQAVAVFRMSADAGGATPAPEASTSKTVRNLAAATGVPALARPGHAEQQDPKPRPRPSAQQETAAEADWEEF